MSWPEYTYHRPQGTPKYPLQKVKTGKGSKKYVLTPEQEAVFRKLYPRTFNARMCDLFGINSSTLHRIARDLGVKKDTKVIRHKKAMAAKKTCEKNGYYDSIRGKLRQPNRPLAADGSHSKEARPQSGGGRRIDKRTINERV